MYRRRVYSPRVPQQKHAGLVTETCRWNSATWGHIFFLLFSLCFCVELYSPFPAVNPSLFFSVGKRDLLIEERTAESSTESSQPAIVTALLYTKVLFTVLRNTILNISSTQKHSAYIELSQALYYKLLSLAIAHSCPRTPNVEISSWQKIDFSERVRSASKI